MSKAPKAVLEALHKALAETFAKILKEGETVVDKETGEAVQITPAASTLNAIRQFLKDNNIDANIETNEDLRRLTNRASLPFPSKPDQYGLPQ